MFVQLQVLTSRGSPEPYMAHTEVIRVDLIQRMRPVELPGWSEECTELTLDNDELIYCQGSITETIALFND